MTTKHLLFFLAGYLILYSIFFHGYQFVMDPDATGYFSVAEKIVRGKFFDSVNGIWSPLGSWLLVPFLKFRFDPIISAKILNALYGFICVWLFFSLVKKFKVHFFIEIILMSGSILLFLDFAFSRLFADLLIVLILLIYLRILCDEHFGKSYRSIILAAIIGGIGFYAKAYTLYFILIHLSIVILIVEKKISNKSFSIISLKKISVSVIALLFTAAFWIISLNNKYGNYVVGQKNIAGTISDIYQPKRIIASVPAEGNYALFDDISNVYSQNFTPFTNWKTFVIQLKLTIVNFVALIGALNEFSFAFVLVILACLYFVLTGNNFFTRSKEHLILFSFIALWPLGFLLFSIQSRFMWIEYIIVMLVCGILLSKFIYSGLMNKKFAYLFSFIIVCSFCIYPLMELKRQYGTGKNLFDIASILKKNNIRGKMMADFEGSQDYSNSIMINYLNHSKYYGPFTSNYSMNEISEAIKNYHIDYYIFYYSNPFEKELFLSGGLASQARSIYKDAYPGIIVLTFND